MSQAVTELILSADELQLLTGYRLPRRQLSALHGAGFIRARIVMGRVVLERAHYEAVCGGQREKERPRLRLPPTLRAA